MARIALDPESADMPDLQLFTSRLFEKALRLTSTGSVTLKDNFTVEELRSIPMKSNQEDGQALERESLLRLRHLQK